MKKTKKAFMYLLGAFTAFIFGKINAFAQEARDVADSIMYGVERFPSTPAVLGRIFILIIIPIVILSALVVGIVIFIKRKRKNDRKDS